MISRPIDELAVGDSAELVRVVTAGDIAGFVEAVGDRNPAHSDPAYAAATLFGEVIAPGIWTAGLISAVLGTGLPGPGTIYISQSLQFVGPVKLGDIITARVEIVEVVRERDRIRLKTICVNQAGQDVLIGEAWVRPPKRRDEYVAQSAGAGDLLFWALQPCAWASQALTAWAKMGRSVLKTVTARATPLGGLPQDSPERSAT